MSKQKPFGNIPYSQGSYATPGMGYGQACRNVNKQTKGLVVVTKSWNGKQPGYGMAMV